MRGYTFEPSRLSPGLRFKGYTPRRFPKCPQVACFVVVSGAPEMSVGKLSGMRELREGCVRKERGVSCGGRFADRLRGLEARTMIT